MHLHQWQEAPWLFFLIVLVSLDSAFEKLEGLLRSTRSGHSEFLPALFVIGDEKLLQLVEQGLAHIADGFQGLVIVGMDRDPQKPVIGFGFPVLNLFRRDDPDDAYIDETTDMSGRVHQNQYVKGVAVLTQRGGNKAEVKRKHHSFGQQSAQHEETGIRIVVKLVAASFRRFYNRPADTLFGVKLERKGC